MILVLLAVYIIGAVHTFGRLYRGLEPEMDDLANTQVGMEMIFGGAILWPIVLPLILWADRRPGR